MVGSALRMLASLMVACILAAPYTEATMNCGTVFRAISPCGNYLTSKSRLTKQCCDGVVRLNKAASSTQDRQTACSCLQKAARGMTGLNTGLASSLPGKCGVNIPYKISPRTDCRRVK